MDLMFERVKPRNKKVKGSFFQVDSNDYEM
jgi:hypothetical protein